MVKANSPPKLENKKSPIGKFEKIMSGKVIKHGGTKNKKKKVSVIQEGNSAAHSMNKVRQELNGGKKSAQKEENSSDTLDKTLSGKVKKHEKTKGKKVNFRKKGKGGQPKKEGTQKVNAAKKIPPKAAAGRNLNKKGKVRNDNGSILQISSEKGPRDGKGASKKFPKMTTEGAVVITNLPHGFYENEMQGFFKQFGAITNLRLARSKKSGKPMGYAFVGFHVPEVAKIVANTLDGYLMFNKILKCKYIRKSEITIGMFKWKGRNATNCLGTERRIKATQNLSKIQSKSAEAKRMERLAKKVEKSKSLLKTMGVNLDLQTPCKPAKEEEQVSEDMKLLKSLDMVPDQTEEEDGGECFMDNKEIIELKRKIAEKLLADVEREAHESKEEVSSGEMDSEELLADVEREAHESKEEVSSGEMDSEEVNEEQKMDAQESENKMVALTPTLKDTSSCEVEEENSDLVLEVDESEDEVQIKTPPNFIKKKVKMTSSTPNTPKRHNTPSSQRKTPLQSMSAKKKRVKKQESKAAGIGSSGKKKRKIESSSL